MLEEEFEKLKWIEKDEFSANAKIFNTVASNRIDELIGIDKDLKI